VPISVNDADLRLFECIEVVGGKDHSRQRGEMKRGEMKREEMIG
jgi:hypothetical protein